MDRLGDSGILHSIYELTKLTNTNLRYHLISRLPNSHENLRQATRTANSADMLLRGSSLMILCLTPLFIAYLYGVEIVFSNCSDSSLAVAVLESRAALELIHVNDRNNPHPRIRCFDMSIH